MRYETTYREYVKEGTLTVDIDDRKFVIDDIYHRYKRSNMN